MLWNKIALSCAELPTPGFPAVAVSGFALSQAMRPFRSSAGRVFRATISPPPLDEIKLTGSKSLSAS
jgi:hypothetical protein